MTGPMTAYAVGFLAGAAIWLVSVIIDEIRSVTVQGWQAFTYTALFVGGFFGLILLVMNVGGLL